jgi:hypothetical protein
MSKSLKFSELEEYAFKSEGDFFPKDGVVILIQRASEFYGDYYTMVEFWDVAYNGTVMLKLAGKEDMVEIDVTQNYDFIIAKEL